MACPAWDGSSWIAIDFAFAVPDSDPICRATGALGDGFWQTRSELSCTGHSIPWIVAFLLGAEAAGLLWACESIFLLSNPFILGVGNWLLPRASHELAGKGLPALRRLLARSALLVLAVMTLFLAFLVMLSEELLRVFYGDSFMGNGDVVAIFGLAGLAIGLSLVASTGLAVLEQTRQLFLSSMAGLAATLALVFPLINWMGIRGAALALLGGILVVCAFQSRRLLLNFGRNLG